MYGEQYVHRQCYITNMWFLAGLSRDCDNRVTIARGGTPHVHLPIAPQSGPGLKSGDVAAFAHKWCTTYARKIHDWVRAPTAERCVVCTMHLPNTKEPVKVSVDELLTQKLENNLPTHPALKSLVPRQRGREDTRAPPQNFLQTEYDGAGAVIRKRVANPVIFERKDSQAKCFRTTMNCLHKNPAYPQPRL